MASGAFSSYLVYLLASAARKVFHRRANVTENVFFSNANGLAIKILSPTYFDTFIYFHCHSYKAFVSLGMR